MSELGWARGWAVWGVVWGVVVWGVWGVWGEGGNDLLTFNTWRSLCSLAFAARCRTVQLGGAKKNDDTKDKEIMRLKGMLRKASLT